MNFFDDTSSSSGRTEKRSVVSGRGGDNISTDDYCCCSSSSSRISVDCVSDGVDVIDRDGVVGVTVMVDDVGGGGWHRDQG